MHRWDKQNGQTGGCVGPTALWPSRQWMGPGCQGRPFRMGAGREDAGDLSFGPSYVAELSRVSGCEVLSLSVISHQWPVSPSEALFCQEVATRGWQRNSNPKAGFPAHSPTIHWLDF